MNGVLHLVRVEMRRALHRRVVWTLIAIALVGVAILGVIAFTDSAGKSVAELGRNGAYPAVMRDWWIAGTQDGILMIATLPLVIGAFLGGASVAGAEWRAGTVTTVLTWDPRRRHVHAARLASCFGLAAVIAIALQAAFLGATLPAVLAHGTTAGVDAGWWLDLAAAVTRIALVAGATAVVGASLATLGRNTTFALGAVFGWMAIGEPLVRGFKPSLQPLLLAENIATVVPWSDIGGESFSRSGTAAALTVAVYVLAVAGAGMLAFTRRDIAGVS